MSEASVGEDVLVCPAEQNTAATHRRGRQRHMTWLKRTATILVAVAQEVFDESAYTRFLQRTQVPSSCAAYATFQQEYEAVKARRPKCC